MEPLVSIITINLNNKSGLIKTVNSVLAQEYKNIEFIIIDGASNDGSLEYIKAVKNNFTYWISEKDKGIYDAMNKGIIQAKGDYLLFLNSGDFFFEPKSLSYLVSFNFKEDIVYGNVGMYVNGALETKYFPSELSLKYFRYDTIPHQSTLIKRNLFYRFGLYNTEYKIVSDWAFFVDCIIKGKVKYRYVNELISIFDLNGISSQPSSYKIIRNEIEQHIKQKYWFSFAYFKLCWAFSYYPKRILIEFGFKFD